MAQYDLHLIQNRAAAGIEFDEEIINVVRGGIMTASADANRNLRWLSGGSEGQIVKLDANGDFIFANLDAGHTQNTDTGTTGTIFELDSDGYKIELTAESASKFGVKVDGGAAYADIEAKDASFNSISLLTGGSVDTIETTISDDDTHIPTSGAVVDYIGTALGANDAMLFKGVIDCNANPNYPAADAGHTYKVSVAGKIGGASGINVEVGDTLICAVDSTSSGDHATVGANWFIIQVNIDGAVIGPASVTDGYIALFDGISGKLIKAGTGAPGTMAYETATDYVAKALFDANTIIAATTDNTPAAVTVNEQTLVGRITSGNIAALSATQVRTLLNVEDGADVTDSTNVNSAGAVMESDFNANTILAADTDNTPAALEVAEQRIVGRITSGNIAALTGTQVMNVIWVAAPASKTATGTAGSIAYDGNYLYICDATNTWIRFMGATNWT